MKKEIIFRRLISLVIILCGGLVFAQEENKTSLDEKLYQEIKSNGLEEAMKMYEKHKTAAYEGLQEPLNLLGYKLMMEDKDLETAEIVFKAQIEEYPEQANPYDSYGDLLLEKGEKEKAKKHFKKSAELAENIQDEAERNEMKQASLSKLARLENKHRKLDFLTGDWEITQTGYRDGQPVDIPKSTQSISYLPGESVLRVTHTKEGNTACCERIVAYDALDDTYEMAYISAVNPNGIQVSDIHIKEKGNGEYEFIEDYTQNGEQKQAKHIISKKDQDHIEWQVLIPKEGSQNWELVNKMEFKRKA
ncbi:hypothetical protein GUB10_06175 [Salegentibacter sp. BLCTC]|uniref:hypothetical protein n=1 Tax=Salegentibacter sp. BLCTC TaxID=2697368 RepID=UPI00187BBC3C|nr:hypothetical protein [Salegentibacter sp. BLCTC]MBE7639912.1 hypothetical protein [Salegentibacter sp. BLCTC]